jgi:hypothetical protein
MHFGKSVSFYCYAGNNVLAKVILFCCVGGQPPTRLFGKDAHTNIKYGGGDEQSHTVEKVFGCGLLVDCFTFLCWATVASFLLGNDATGALTALQLCFSEAVASASFWDYD